MKKISVVSAIALLTPAVAHALDSIYTIDVVVTASRVPQMRENVLADVSVIGHDEIQRTGQSSITELLLTLPGVEIESNGGLGSASAIHLRGTGSQAVVVLLDGMRIGSSTTGTSAFELISPDQIDRIEVLRGTASSLYGADAVGGVIQIFTKHGKEKPHVSASVGYGSDNTRKATAGLSGAMDNTRFALNISMTDTNGISSKRTIIAPESDRDNYRNRSISGSVSHEYIPGHELGIQFYDSFNRAAFDDDFLFPAHQEMIQRSVSITSRNQFLPRWESILKIGQGEDDQKSFGSSFGYDANRTYQRQYSWQNNVTLPAGMLTLAYDRLEEHVNAKTNFTTKRRENNGWLASYLLDEGAHSFQVSLRRDDNSQFGQHNTGNIGYGFRIAPQWRLTGSFGTAFRAPNFNDLYYPFTDYSFPPFFHYTYQGNPNLKPETSRNREVSVVFDNGHHRVSATAYDNTIKNLIVGAQGLPDDFSTNIGSASIRGLTVAYEGWMANFHLRGSGDFQNAENDDTHKQLVRRAHQHGAFWVGQSWGNLEVGTEVIAAGKRYNDAANQFKLHGYTLLNLTANYRINQDWELGARINNLFNREYALATNANSYSPNAPAFGTPGTNAFITLRWQPK